MQIEKYHTKKFDPHVNDPDRDILIGAVRDGSEPNHHFVETSQTDISLLESIITKKQTDIEQDESIWKLKLRPFQADFVKKINQPHKRFHLLIAHRRFGKTLLCSSYALDDAQNSDVIGKETRDGTLRPPTAPYRGAYIMPTISQAKRTVMPYFKTIGDRMGGLFSSENLTFTFANSSFVQLLGWYDPQALRGSYYDLIILDEWAFAKNPRAIYDEVLEPQLRDYNGQVIFTGTVDGQNHLYHLKEHMERDIAEKGDHASPYTVSIYPNSLTKMFSDEELRPIREKNYFAYRQEYECDFHAPVEGAFYGELLRTAEEEGRVDVFSVGDYPVFTFWDIGKDDDTVVWFVQFPEFNISSRILIIDYMEGNNMRVKNWAHRVMQRANQRGYQFYKHMPHKLPHDAQNETFMQEYGAKAMLESAFGVMQTEVIKKIGLVQTRISQTREIIPLCVFHKNNCKIGLEKLSLYRREYDSDSGKYSEKPLKNGMDHAADAFGAIAQWLNGETSRIIRSNRLAKLPKKEYNAHSVLPIQLQQLESEPTDGLLNPKNRIIV